MYFYLIKSYYYLDPSSFQSWNDSEKNCSFYVQIFGNYTFENEKLNESQQFEDLHAAPSVVINAIKFQSSLSIARKFEFGEYLPKKKNSHINEMPLFCFWRGSEYWKWFRAESVQTFNLFNWRILVVNDGVEFSMKCWKFFKLIF